MSLTTKQIKWKQLSGNPGFDDFGGVSLGDGVSQEQAVTKKVSPLGIYVTVKDELMVIRNGKWVPAWELGHIITKVSDFVDDTANGSFGLGEVQSAHLLPYQYVDPILIAGYPHPNQVLAGTGSLTFENKGVYLIAYTAKWASTATGDADIVMTYDGATVASLRAELMGNDIHTLVAYVYVANDSAHALDLTSTGTAPSQTICFAMIRVSLLKS